jgi:hypothetical protein
MYSWIQNLLILGKEFIKKYSIILNLDLGLIIRVLTNKSIICDIKFIFYLIMFKYILKLNLTSPSILNIFD